MIACVTAYVSERVLCGVSLSICVILNWLIIAFSRASYSSVQICYYSAVIVVYRVWPTPRAKFITRPVFTLPSLKVAWRTN